MLVPPTEALEVRVRVLPARVKREEKRLVEDAVVAKKLVVVAFVVVLRVMLSKMLAPEKRLSLERRVEEAAPMVISAEPLKETPLMFLAVSRTVAEPALPETVPVKLPVPLVKNKLVDEAVVEKRLVVVAEVVVELPVMIKLESIVEEAVERKPLRKPRVVEVETPHDVGVHEKVPEPPVGQVVRHVSAVRQKTSAERLVVEALVA